MAEDLDVFTECPSCGGEIYDNRAKNKERIAAGEKPMPDLKCKDKDCGWVKWPPREKKAYSGGGGGFNKAPRVPELTASQIVSNWDWALKKSVVACGAVKERGFTTTAADVLAGAATLLIASQRAGVTFGAPKPVESE